MLLQERPKENKMEKGQKYKNCVFQVGIQKMRKMTRIFSKNRLTPFVSERKKKTRVFVHTFCFAHFFGGPKQGKPRKIIEMVVSAEIAQNLK